jgi:hypothetical protein
MLGQVGSIISLSVIYLLWVRILNKIFGCIRLPEKMVVQFFKNAAVGTPVEVRHAVAPN